ncbi:metal-dependent hydrolase [Maribacter arcticus]|uniref:Inner membrane protein n=1 Tax=Maribacter arcticus TaxID=561365 RepID=A0A1T5B0P4_9FLAO|nr:metal-dependent hydrolase [Maribacter arcticus]SKB40649.1 inner membrane protein [Maribacter arcticus]|tara:strand:- start:2182 stop:3183 length:1002 start_codon:yes stop_codon:yes gene_type:complete
MDSLTQIVLGAAVGEVVLGRKVGNRAMLYGAIAGTIPDLDVLTRFFMDTVTATEWHRGFSHSIFFSILFAPVFGWLVWRLNSKEDASWKDWSWLMFWGLFTHPILDAFTTWGTQLFWPLKTRLAFQSVFVIDPLYTVPFIIFLILALFQNRTALERKRYVKLGLIISSSYLLLTLVLKGIAFGKFEKALEVQGIAYNQMNTRPAPFNTILWMANIETEDAYLMGNYSFFDSKPIVFTAYPKNHELLGSLKSKDKIKRLIQITEGWYTISEKKGQLYFNDLRFGLISMDETVTQFAFSYKLEPIGEDIIVEEMPKFKRDAKHLMASLWLRIWGN